MTKKEYDELCEVVKGYLVPKNIEFWVNGSKVSYQEPYKIIEAILPTEFEENGMFRRTQRKTEIHILETNDGAKLYEMGLPITEIDCKFSIDVQQKVPLSFDRDTVPQSFLSQLYAEVLNETYKDIKENEVSQVWVREATGNKKISQEAVKEVIEKRYGDKVVVANPMDKNSIDDAIASGYRVIYGSELSKEEWGNIKSAGIIQSSSEMFGTGTAKGKSVEPDENMLRVAKLAKKIAEKCLGIKISVAFFSWEGTTGAQFGNNALTFNVGALGKKFFNPPINARVIDLIIHEIGHSAGLHIEKEYHQCLTKVAGELVIVALNDPKFFNV